MSHTYEGEDDYAVKMRQQSKRATAVLARHFKKPEPLPEPPAPVANDLEILKAQLQAKEDEIQRLCAEIDEVNLSPQGPFQGVRIAKAIAKSYGISFTEMISHRRAKHLVLARQHAMYEMKQHTTLSMPSIARILGGRDHTTVLHGIRAHQRRVGNAK